MSGFVTFLLSFWEYLPWLVIALMAMLALRKNPQSKTLQLQTIGAGSAFVLGTIKWVLDWILLAMSATRVASDMEVIFRFLLFIALAVFATGYCLERFRRRGAEVVQVSARPVD